MSEFRLSDLLLLPFVFGVAVFLSSMFADERCREPGVVWLSVAMFLAYPLFGKGKRNNIVGDVTFGKWFCAVAICGILLWILGWPKMR